MQKFWAWLLHWFQWDPHRDNEAGPQVTEPALEVDPKTVNSDADAPDWLKSTGLNP